MVRTYVIEDTARNVVEYFGTLRDAKRYCVRNFDKPLTILAMHGQSFGEGFHKYRLRLNASKLVFKRERV